MVAFSKVAVAAYFAVGAFAVPLSLPAALGPLEVFSSLLEVPVEWVSKGAAPKSNKLTVQIGLKQQNVEQLQTKLLDISNPKSANYGKWLKKEEVDALVAPSANNIAAVKSWLTSSGIAESDISQPNSGWVQFSASVSTLESLLSAEYESFWSDAEGRSIDRTKEYSVPANLHDKIDLVTPTTIFYSKIGAKPSTPKAPASNSTLSARQSCDGTNITPSCINSLYNVDYTSAGNAMVATVDLGSSAIHSDYAAFGSMYVPGLVDFTEINYDNGSNDQGASSDNSLEGNLDTQYSAGVAYPNPAYYILMGDSDGFAGLATYLTSGQNPPTSVSTSYSTGENGQDPDYLNRVCNEYMMAGSMGISVFFSSGDSGVGGETSCSTFDVAFPASCPWVTAVGATQFSSGVEGVAQYGDNGGSGGGFSTVFAAPDYQSADTASYISGLNGEYSGQFNASNRGYPDISLVGESFNVINGGQQGLVGGTSASSPSVAALVSVLNDYRASKGEASLGFLNTMLYGSARSATRDVTTGSNNGCGTSGFPATSGWDAATGLGSFDFGTLRSML